MRVGEVPWGQWFPWNAFCDAISPHSFLTKQCLSVPLRMYVTLQAQFSDIQEREPSLHPEFMIQVAICSLTKYSLQLFNTYHRWTTQMYAFSHWGEVQTTSATLPDHSQSEGPASSTWLSAMKPISCRFISPTWIGLNVSGILSTFTCFTKIRLHKWTT